MGLFLARNLSLFSFVLFVSFVDKGFAALKAPE